MTEEQKYLTEHPALIRFKEDFTYNQQLLGLTVFPYNNIYNQGKISKIILNFSFKDIDFNKKKALAFFLAMELLTNQKCIATLSSKNILAWKLRKGMLVGCKVSLRGKNLFEFLDNLNLALPRMEKFQPLKYNKTERRKSSSYIIHISEVVLFYPIELGLGINTEVKKLEINMIFNTTTREEKLFFMRSNKIPVNT